MSTALSLYNIEENLLALLDTAEMVEGEVDQLAILNEIAQASEQAVQKRRNVRGFILWLQAQQALCKAERDRIDALEKHYASTEKRVSNYVAMVIQEFAPEPKKGQRKLDCGPGILSIRKNPESVDVSDEAAVPSRFKAVTITVPAVAWESLVHDSPEEVASALGPLDQIKADCRVERRAVKAAIDAGETVPGAAMKVGGIRLDVK
jgi:hypothetical protein